MIIRNLSIGYKSHTVADGVSFRLEKGQLTCLLGENGVGKSTLLRTLAGFQKPLGGSVIIDGEDMAKLSPRDVAQRIAVVLTDKPDLPNTTVRELVALGRMPYTGFFGRLTKEDYDIVDDCLSAVGFKPTARTGKNGGGVGFLRALSDGERQKVMIARALAQQTQYILLDEPTAFLDYPSKLHIMQMLRQLAHDYGKYILLSTHDVEIALDIADSIVMMERGAIHTGKPKPRNHETIASFTADSLLALS